MATLTEQGNIVFNKVLVESSKLVLGPIVEDGAVIFSLVDVYTKTWQADVLFEKLGITDTYSTDILIKKPNITETITADILLMKEGTGDIDADVLFKKLGVTSGKDVDVLLRAFGITTSCNMDLLLAKLNLLESFGVDTSIIKEGIIQAFTINTLIGSWVTQTLSKEIDVILMKSCTKSANIDVNLQKSITESYTLNTLFQIFDIIKERNVDTLIKKADNVIPISTDAIFQQVYLRTYGIDANLLASLTLSLGVDTIIVERIIAITTVVNLTNKTLTIQLSNKLSTADPTQRSAILARTNK